MQELVVAQEIDIFFGLFLFSCLFPSASLLPALFQVPNVWVAVVPWRAIAICVLPVNSKSKASLEVSTRMNANRARPVLWARNGGTRPIPACARVGAVLPTPVLAPGATLVFTKTLLPLPETRCTTLRTHCWTNVKHAKNVCPEVLVPVVATRMLGIVLLGVYRPLPASVVLAKTVVPPQVYFESLGVVVVVVVVWVLLLLLCVGAVVVVCVGEVLLGVLCVCASP
jgi:hypothetical protein